MTKDGNLLVVQSGSSSAVSNTVLHGVLTEALNHAENIEEIYGARHGFAEMGKGNFVDLASLPQRWAKKLLYTPGCVLGIESTAFRDSSFDENTLATLREFQIRYLVCIGDKSSIRMGKALAEKAKKLGYDFRWVMAPCSSHNDLPISDHSLGYGSMLKYLGASLSAFENKQVSEGVRMSVYEIGGGNSGWLAAGSSLVKSKHFKIENPFVLCLPEQPFREEHFLQVVTHRMQSQGYVVVVTNDQLVDSEGNYIVGNGERKSASDTLSDLLTRQLKVHVGCGRCDLSTAPLSPFISLRDQREAVLVGQESVRALLEGQTDVSATLVRNKSEDDGVEVTFVPSQSILEGTKFFPADWLVENEFWPDSAFLRYALPLIQGEVATVYEKGIPHLASPVGEEI
ncbi:MAG: 6-phosphofructokinase [Puniceicoccales bacterium]|jgi:6-phosphofructokinase 1|nr:6-phosphofructokinase [Puniceicoccales bacterium]